jgi:hypothetical protein
MGVSVVVETKLLVTACKELVIVCFPATSFMNFYQIFLDFINLTTLNDENIFRNCPLFAFLSSYAQPSFSVRL